MLWGVSSLWWLSKAQTSRWEIVYMAEATWNESHTWWQTGIQSTWNIYKKSFCPRVCKNKEHSWYFYHQFCRYVTCQILDIHQILEVWQSMLDKVPGLILDVSKIKVCRKASSLFCAQRWDIDSEPEAVQTLKIFSAHMQPCKHMFSVKKSYLQKAETSTLRKDVSLCVCDELQSLAGSHMAHGIPAAVSPVCC